MDARRLPTIGRWSPESKAPKLRSPAPRLGQIEQVVSSADCRSAAFGCGGSIPSLPTRFSSNDGPEGSSLCLRSTAEKVQAAVRDRTGDDEELDAMRVPLGFGPNNAPCSYP